jgi:hypothetical protein
LRNFAPVCLRRHSTARSTLSIPKVANKKDLADVAVEFIRIDDSNKDDLDRLEKLNVLIKEKHVPISNLGLFTPTQVVAAVAARVPSRFTMGAHTAAWHRGKVRPAAAAQSPTRPIHATAFTDTVHNDYVYTQAWIDKLVAELTPSVLRDGSDRRGCGGALLKVRVRAYPAW